MDPTTYPLQDSTVCSPALVAGGGQIISAFGSYSSQKSAAAARNQAAINNHEYQLAQRENRWMQDLSIWNHKIAEFDATVFENTVAANKGYAAEQQKLNEIYNQASFSQQDQLIKLMGSLGQNYARGATGKSAQRSNDMMLAAIGREQAKTAASLVSAQQANRTNNEGLRDQLISANNRAYSSVALKPVAGVAPPAPVLESGPSPLTLIGSVMSAGAGMMAPGKSAPPGLVDKTPINTTTFPGAYSSNFDATPIFTQSLSPSFYDNNLPFVYN